MGSEQRNSERVFNTIKAKWTSDLREILIDLCLEQISIGNKPGSCFSREGWTNILDSFHRITGLEYGKKQVRNHLDITKAQWKTWHKLISTDMMKWDSETRRFDATDEEWTEYLERNPDAAQFRFKELEFIDKLDIIYGGTVDSGEALRKPRRRKHIDYSTSTLPSIQPKKLCNYSIIRERPTNCWPTLESLTAIPDTNIERCCDAVESRTVQSPVAKLSYSIEECIKCLDAIEELEQGCELYLFALDIFLKQEYREIFLNLKKSSTRIAWLERLQSAGTPLHLGLEA